MGLRASIARLLGRTPEPIAAAPAPATRDVYVADPRAKAVGGAATPITGGRIEQLDQNVEVRGSSWYGEPGTLGIGAKMMADAHVRQSVEYVIAPLVAGDWRVRPASDEPLDREVASLVEHALFDRMPWKRLVRSIVRGYVRDGFYLLEETDDWVQVPRGRFPLLPGNGRAVLPTGLHERPAWSITMFNPSVASPQQLASVTQYLRGGDAEKSGTIDIPAERLIRFTWDQDGANFAGLPILRSAYGPWKSKYLLLTISMINHERNGVGLPVLKLGPNATREDIEVAEQALAELRANEKGFWINPDAFDLKLLESQNRGEGLEASIARCNIDIAMNVAAGFMLLSLTKDTGSNALAGTQQGQHHLGVVGHGEFVASVFNFGADGWSLIERIVRMNYGPDVAIPRLEVRHLPTRDWLDVVKQYFAGVESSALTADDATEDEIRSILQLNPHDRKTARTRPGGQGDKPGTTPAGAADGAVEGANMNDGTDAASGPADPATAVRPDTALNGAQVTAFRQLLLDVAERQMPRQSGVEAIAAAFPLTVEQADKVMGEIGRTFFVEKQAPAQPPADAPTEPADGNDTEDPAGDAEAA